MSDLSLDLQNEKHEESAEKGWNSGQNERQIIIAFNVVNIGFCGKID